MKRCRRHVSVKAQSKVSDAINTAPGKGTISQGVRRVPSGRGLRRCRYCGLAKTTLQHLATAAAINLDRLVAWFDEMPQAKTRKSRFARLAPT